MNLLAWMASRGAGRACRQHDDVRPGTPTRLRTARSRTRPVDPLSPAPPAVHRPEAPADQRVGEPEAELLLASRAAPRAPVHGVDHRHGRLPHRRVPDEREGAPPQGLAEGRGVPRGQRAPRRLPHIRVDPPLAAAPVRAHVRQEVVMPSEELVIPAFDF
jgi:hypothetical protein